MYLLTRTAKICHHNVGHLCSPSQTSSPVLFNCLWRLLSTSQWKKYLNILDVGKSSTPKDIKTSFLKLSKIYHPDNKTTGSHSRFVELKEAYDALKDGHPTTTTTTTAEHNRYNNYYDTDVTYEGHKSRRERYQDYQTQYEQKNYGFGGPYKYSEQPWEDLKRDRMYRRQQAYEASFSSNYKGSSLVSLTIVLSAMAWIVIYSSVLLIWDYNDSVAKGMAKYKARSHDDYLAYQEYVKKKEASRLAKMERIRLAREHEIARIRVAERLARAEGGTLMTSSSQQHKPAPANSNDTMHEEASQSDVLVGTL